MGSLRAAEDAGVHSRRRPAAVWQPADRFNERWLELMEVPGRRRHAFRAMYGLELPDEALRKLYYRNALRLIPGLDATPFPR